MQISFEVNLVVDVDFRKSLKRRLDRILEIVIKREKNRIKSLLRSQQTSKTDLHMKTIKMFDFNEMLFY